MNGTFPKKFDLSFSTSTPAEILGHFQTSDKGLSTREAHKRLVIYGHNEVAKKKQSQLLIFLSKFTNPLIIILLIVSALSFEMGQALNSIIVIAMALLSVVMAYVQEYKAGKEAERLREMVKTTASVYRDGSVVELPMKDIVPGDIVYLSAGDLVPADLRIVSCKDLYINQASITGEAFPAEKVCAPFKTAPGASSYGNIAFAGTNVVSGTALGVAILTGPNTQFGELAVKASQVQQDTAFDSGIRNFSMLMIKFMLVLVVALFIINGLLKRDFLEALLFSLAVAVGLTPEMLPMILTVNLAQGAISLAKKRVIVKKLSSIQNFGSMDVLCTDKTGTLTLGEVILEKHLDLEGNESEEVLFSAYLNSYYQTGLKNLLDKAILKHGHIKVGHVEKVDELPFDFSRKIMSVVVKEGGKHILISKGAPDEIMKRCTGFDVNGKVTGIKKSFPVDIAKMPDKMRNEGFRILAVAYREFETPKASYSGSDESDLVLQGFMLFLDPPKPTAKSAIHELNEAGVAFKVLSGDNELVCFNVCNKVGIKIDGMLTGDQVTAMSDTDLRAAVEKNSIFARLTPSQKERIILMLRKNGHTVGYMGDGINDAQALRVADVGISVNNAVDIAKESADFILMEKSLHVLKNGVVEGRRVFGNITKYIRMGSSSNLGNMISFTGASLFLPFLPMTSVQVIFNNFLYDVSQLATPTDAVDQEYLQKPLPWDIKSIQRFMVFIGPVSSIFDFATFGLLLWIQAPLALFHTVWFIESLVTQTLAIHVIRTSKIPFLESMPSAPLLGMSLLIVGVGLFFVLSPIGAAFGFMAPSLQVLLMVAGIVVLYLILLQVAKMLYSKKFGYY